MIGKESREKVHLDFHIIYEPRCYNPKEQRNKVNLKWTYFGVATCPEFLGGSAKTKAGDQERITPGVSRVALGARQNVKTAIFSRGHHLTFRCSSGLLPLRANREMTELTGLPTQPGISQPYCWRCWLGLWVISGDAGCGEVGSGGCGRFLVDFLEQNLEMYVGECSPGLTYNFRKAWGFWRGSSITVDLSACVALVCCLGEGESQVYQQAAWSIDQEVGFAKGLQSQLCYQFVGRSHLCQLDTVSKGL